MKVSLNKNKCTKCGKCCRIAPSVFSANKRGDILVKAITEDNKYTVITAINQCPFHALNAEHERDSKTKTNTSTIRSDTTNLDIKKCTKCGKCCRIAPDVFSVNENGDIVVGTITDENKYSVMTAQNQCPVHAISIEISTAGYNVKIHQKDGQKILGDIKTGDENNLPIYKYISIASGEYLACFTSQKEYDEFSRLKTIITILNILSVIILPTLFLLVFTVGSEVLLIIFATIYLIIMFLLRHDINSIKYKVIRRALVNKGYRITYENQTTGTISYKIGKQHHSLSVYKGYNSKWQSRYK